MASFTDDDLLAAGRKATQASLIADKLSAFSQFEVATPPKKYAETLNIASREGIPVAAVPEFADQIAARERQQSFIDLQSSAPKTAQWLSQDPGNAVLFRDAVRTAHELENIIHARKAPTDISRAATGAYVSAGTILPSTAGGLMGVARAVAENVFEPPANLLRAVMGQERATPISDYYTERQKHYEGLSTELAKAAETELLAGGVSPQISSGVTSGFQMMGQVGLAVLAPGAALPTMATTVFGHEYGAARDKNLDPARALLYGSGETIIETLTEKFAFNKFLKAVESKGALTKAAAGMALREIPGEQMATFFQDLHHAAVLEPTRPISEFWAGRKDAALQTLVATLVGGGGAMTISATLDTLQKNWGKTQLSLNMAESESVLSKNKAAIAEDANTRISQMFAIANEHPLREIHAAKFNEFVATLTEESDLTEVYISAPVLAEVLRNNGVTLQEVQAVLPEVAAQLAENANVQGDVRISIPDLLAHVTNPAVQEAILPHLKTAPDGFTYTESQSFYQSEVAALEKRATEIAAAHEPVLTREEFLAEQAKPESTLAQPIDQGKEGVAPAPVTYDEYLTHHKNQVDVRVREISTLRNDIATEMKAMKAFPSHIITAYATPLTEFYAVNAARMKKTVAEIRELLPLKFVANQLTGYQQPSSHFGASMREAAREANAESFKADQVKDLLRKTDWAILTAENPNAEQLTPEENAVRNAELEADLQAMGVQYQAAIGKYGNLENSFTVTGITREQAQALGEKYGQDSVLTRDGLIYRDGTVNAAKAVNVFQTAPEDFYTTLPDGTMFAVDIDFSVKRPLGEPRVGEVEVKGVHFSREGRTVLSGTKYGTGISGAERRRLEGASDARIKERISFYVDEGQGVFPEAGVGAFKHDAPLGNMYDAANNPLRFPSEDSNAFESAVLDAGFDGYYVEKGFGRQGTAVLLGQVTRNFEVDNPPLPTNKSYAQAVNEIAGNEAPEGKLTSQDLADLRKLWSIYAASEDAALYGVSQAKAEDNSPQAMQKALRDTITEVTRGRVDFSLKNITKWHEGTSRLPSGGMAFHVVSGKREMAVYMDMADRSMQIDITGWGEGGGGSGLYKALLTFSQNNKFTFFGDSQGISVPGIKRRLENMLSHAIQSGDTSYMRLHPKQISFIEQETGVPINWEIGSHKNNVEQMLNASYNLSNLDIPELKNAYYDFTQQTFVTGSGEVTADLAGYIAKARRNLDPVRREGAAGLATASRTVFSNTLLRARSPEARSAVFASVARLSLDGLPGASRLLYQSEPTGKPAFYSALTRAFEETKLAKAAPEQWLGTLNSLTQKGVKPMEIEYTGLREWLEARKFAPDSWHTYQDGLVVSTRPATDPKPEGDVRLYQPSKTVVKEEIIDFLKENAVTVSPKVYGGEANTPFEFSFGDFQTEEPDSDYLHERATETVQELDDTTAEEKLADIADDFDVEEAVAAFSEYRAASYQAQREMRTQKTLGFQLFEKLVDEQYEEEEENYWSDSDAPSFRSISVETGGSEYEFTHYYSYGEHYLRSKNGEELLLSSRPDDAEIESAIRAFLAEKYDEYESLESTKFESYTLDGGENYRERLLTNASHTGKAFTYTSHFEDENIIGFSRVDDRAVDLENLRADFPDLAARLEAEGRTSAKVYFLEEVQSDWAQQGRDKPEVKTRYKLEEITVDTEDLKGRQAARDTLRIQPREVQQPGEEVELRYDVLNADGVMLLPNAYTKEEAVEKADRLLSLDVLTATVPDNTFTITKKVLIQAGLPPTPEGVKQYIVANKTHHAPGTMTAFDISRERGKLLKESERLRSEQREAEPHSEQAIALQRQRDVLEAQLEALPIARDAVPVGAFVESTDAWVALLMKDAIHQAAEGGFDLVSWTTGDQQTQRWSYGLRKQVDEIRWTKSEDGKIHIVAMKGTRETANTRYGENDLSAAIGKTMAKRIIEDPNAEGTLQGDDIVVADLGMTKFYGDQHGLNPDGNPAIVTKVANQILKKLGGKQVVGSELKKRDKFGHAQAKDFEDSNFSKQPAFEITPAMRDLAMQGQPLFQKQRGAFDPEAMVMSLMQGADLSTVLHESGHFYLEALRLLSEQPEATEQQKKDFQTTLEWFGVKDRATWEALSFEEKRPFHEQWAQSNERWMLEGKAPTLEMQPVFARFRAWMLRVYVSLEQFLKQNPLAGKLNDDVRGVFSRLIASEEMISQAESARGYTSLLPSGGVDPETFAGYVASGEEATQEALTDMQRRSLKDMKWLSNAKAKAVKNLQKQADEKRRALKEEVTKEVMAEPLNQARTWLTKGETIDPASGDAIKAVKGFRLDTQALAEMYPATALSRPDLSALRGMTGKEGLHPDAVAQMFGFRSGDALVRELVSGEKAAEKIEGVTDQRMLEQNGDLVNVEAIERAAEAAIHNEARSRFLATGLQMLTKSKVPVRDIVKAAKQVAEATLSRKKVRDIRAAQYEAAEAKANKEALVQAAKDPAKAVDAQRAALLNNQLAKAATETLDEVQKAIRYVDKFKNEGTRKNLDLEYLEQIDDLLAAIDLRKGTSLKEIDKRRTLAEWVAKQEDRGFEPIIDAAYLESIKRKHYKDMTVEEVLGLVDSVKQIEHLGRLKKKLLTAKDAREFAERIAEASASLEANANRTVKERATPSDVAGTVGRWARQMAASHRKFASIIREMDGGKDDGVMWNLLSRSMNESGDTETRMKAEAATRMAEMFSPVISGMGGFTGSVYAKRYVVPGTKLSMTYEERLMFAMNWGNEGNRQRLLSGGLAGNRAITEDDAQAVLDTLTREDWNFVQSIWDYVASFKPLVAEQERRLTGKEPKWVEPAPFTTPFGEMRGGYFPAKYDAELSTRSESLEAATNLRQGMQGAFNSAATRKGYTQERAAEVKNRPMLLSFNAASQHINEVIHRIAWQDWLVDANRVMKALDGPIRDSYGAEIAKEMRDTIKDIANGDAPSTTPVETAINRVRVGSTIVGLGWRFTTALLQPSGLAQSWVRVGGPWIARGLKSYLTDPIKAAAMAEEKSSLMRDRGRTMQREINEVLNVVRAGEGVSNLTASYFYLIAKLQRTVDVPTWHGAYEKAMANLRFENAPDEKTRKEIEAHAIALADQAVIDSQSGGQLKDLAKVQRGSPVFKLFTNFYSYFSATYNLNIESYRRTSFKNPAEIGLFAADMLILNTLPVVFSLALKEMLKGGCEEGDLECLAGRLAHEQLGFLMGQMILLREAGSALDAATGGQGFGYTGPAGLRFFSDLYRLGQQVEQGDADLALFKAANAVGGTLLHYPAGQVNTTLEGVIAIEKGEVEGVGIVSALVAGKPRRE